MRRVLPHVGRRGWKHDWDIKYSEWTALRNYDTVGVGAFNFTTYKSSALKHVSI